MNEEEFDGQSVLSEKLAKLYDSQKCIESLSGWCIFHRKKAKQIVETWDKSFKSAKSERQRIAFLYLANDILQNSRRKGSEFVNEFWKYLPAAVKHVYDHGNENEKKASARLIDIWEERKVFQGRGQNLRDEILYQNPTPTYNQNINIDSQSLRPNNEEGVKEMEQHIDKSSSKASDECVRQLEKDKTSRVALISDLKEALENEEIKLEKLRCALQVARGQIDRVESMKQRLLTSSQQMPANPLLLIETTKVNNTTTSKLTHEESKKATAAAVAAKLAASTSPAQILTSVLSSFIAEEAASRGASLSSVGFSTSLPNKRPNSEKQPSFSPMNHSDGNPSGFVTSAQQQQPSVGMQLMSQGNQMQSPFPQPPPPSLALANSAAATQIGQSTATMMPYSYGASSLPPPPLPSSHLGMAFPRPSPLQQPPSSNEMAFPRPSPLQQPPSSNEGYYQPPGIGFYCQTHQPTPPAPKQ